MPGLRPPKEDLIPQLPIETEQKVLKATVALTILGTLFLIIALATDYWLILSVIGEPHVMKTGNLLLGSHSGLWRSCLDIQYANSTDTFSNCTNLFDLMEDAEKAKKQANTVEGGPSWNLELAKSSVVFALISLVLIVLVHVFAYFGVREGRFTWKRLTGILSLMTAVCVLVLIQITSNSAETKEEYAEKVQGLEDEMIQASFGSSWIISWIVLIFYSIAGVTFLLCSKKRLQLENEFTGGGDTSADAPLRLS